MDQIPLVTSSTIVPLENFWSSVLNYHDRPHLINRKLAAVAPILLCEIHCSGVKRLSDVFRREALLYEIRKLKDLTAISVDFLKAVTETCKNLVLEETTWDRFASSPNTNFITARVLFGRSTSEKCLEFVIFDKTDRNVTFFPVQERGKLPIAPIFPYHIELTKTGNLRICLNDFEDAETPSAEWLADKLFPKIMKWSENPQESTIKSLNLIEPQFYCTLYTELKTKYAPELLEAWPQKTKTDPKKYVYEDLAIATYLICLWRKYDKRGVNFVDCGCGNGLLVYVLNQEGFKGCGLDIRARKTWEIYGNKADLRVETVQPSSVFPDVTWIIGNHSDELTPWIPVIALRSSPVTNYFVLPCCTYDFSGRKYARSNTKLSQYNDYMGYIETISEMCGFETSVDKLRIPSTKRTCLVGVRNNPDSSTLLEINTKVNEFIGERMNSGFVPRSSVEKIRNCTQLSRGLIDKIVNCVVTVLLSTSSIIEREDGKGWNQGGRIHLADLSQKVCSDDLKLLKNECGGLQTLLKNHRYIFQVQGGVVALRLPLGIQNTSKYRDKPCWFLRNHPDGCLFGDETCACKH